MTTPGHGVQHSVLESAAYFNAFRTGDYDVGIDFTWSVPCTATADPNIGASCILDTTADALLPGSARA